MGPYRLGSLHNFERSGRSLQPHVISIGAGTACAVERSRPSHECGAKRPHFSPASRTAIISTDLPHHRKRDQIRSQTAEILALLKHETAIEETSTETILSAIASIAKGYPAIEQAFLFGSFARGAQSSDSDVDVQLDSIAASASAFATSLVSRSKSKKRHIGNAM